MTASLALPSLNGKHVHNDSQLNDTRHRKVNTSLFIPFGVHVTMFRCTDNC